MTAEPADAGCPDGYEPEGILITKSGKAFLVCIDRATGGRYFEPLN